MSNELTVNPILHSFRDDEFGQIRIVMINGEPWFVAMDVARALGYKLTGDMLRMLKETEIQKIAYALLACANSDQNPMIRDISLINESGFYRAVFGSRKESAERFKDKVYGEILPQIRKTGAYLPENILDNPELLRDILDKYIEEKKAKEKAIKEKAYISNKREATAMATASTQTRIAKRLEIENKTLQIKLDQDSEWWTVRRIEKFLGKTFPSTIGQSLGKKLAKAGREMGIPPKQVPDQLYDHVYAHHFSVIEYSCEDLAAEIKEKQKCS